MRSLLMVILTDDLDGKGGVDGSVRIDGLAGIRPGIVHVESGDLELPAADPSILPHFPSVFEPNEVGLRLSLSDALEAECGIGGELPKASSRDVTRLHKERGGSLDG